MRKPAYVYRHIGSDGETLYVGCTEHMPTRTGGHRKKPWWSDVAQVAFLGPFPRDVAQRLELLLIRRYEPANNVFGTRRMRYANRDNQPTPETSFHQARSA